ncbi:MAG: outer membrane protein assembly factor BamA [Desulfobacterales bacterium]|nr:MAG: outer membrane protein assembly factor BamA [Desulfobacterales bacterium]
MIKRSSLVFIVLLCLFPRSGYGQPRVGVIVMPFEVHAQEDLSYLKNEIPTVIKRFLREDGAIIVEPEILSDSEWAAKYKSAEALREVGLQSGADFVVWGSLTWIGQKFSLDAQLLATLETRPPRIFAIEGEGIENLPGKVRDLAQEISLRIFKREKVLEVGVVGNQRIEADAITRVVKTKPGDVYLAQGLSDDLKAIYALGYFDDVRVEVQTQAAGKKVMFRVQEKPTVHSILISGNTWVYDDDDIKEVLEVRKGSILNVNKIQNDMRRIEELYKEKNYYNAQVTYKVLERPNNQADLEFVIEEGSKLRITAIKFEGNRAYSDKKLKKEIKTAEKSIFSWITSAGDLDQENLSQDVAKLTAFYHNHGYIDAKVGEPQIEYLESGIEITIKISEGSQFKVGEVRVAGDLIFPEDQLFKKIKITREEFYNREIVRKDIIDLTDLYADEGYAYVDITPITDPNPEKLVVDITYEFHKGQQVYFEQINISGNTKTRDKVIRRELRVYEQELFGGSRLKRGVRNLYRLDYFEDIRVNTSKGSADDRMVLDVDVTEKSTGAFSFGAGFGNVENFFGTASISERNLFGRGQTLALKGLVGFKTTRFTLSFTEPWLFDIPLSAGVDLYNWRYTRNDYEQNSLGGKLRFGYPLFDYTRGYIAYNYDVAKISDVEDDASDSIKELEGTNVKSSILTSLHYDSRDQTFNPSRGSDHSVSLELAGLGGDIGFTKYLAETAWYFPLLGDLVGVARAQGGYVNDAFEKKLPDYEKFYIGGINTLRGFERDDLSPRDGKGAEIGGEIYAVANLELTFPLVKQAGVIGVVFLDNGNVYRNADDLDLSDLRHSAGGGIRWLSPVGPIRLEYGFILDSKDTDHGSGRFEFSMGAAF